MDSEQRKFFAFFSVLCGEIIIKTPKNLTARTFYIKYIRLKGFRLFAKEEKVVRFVNRKEEMTFLNKKWETNRAQFIVVYGRRRVGKTELCIQFAKGKPHIYYQCERLKTQNQLKKFTDIVRAYFKDEFLPTAGFPDWELALKYIAKQNKHLVVIIDEFPYLTREEPGISSTFQKIWDQYLKNSKVYLILLGSSVSMMERDVLSQASPLYGRRTGQQLVQPFSFLDVMAYFKEKSFEEALIIYSILGGIPYYLNRFKGRRWESAVEEEILQKGEPLYNEVEFLLREELHAPRHYFMIIEAISLGKRKLSEIINYTGFDKGTVSRYIAILNDLKITRREVPITEKEPHKSRWGIYFIEDNFVNFWFRYIFKNRSFLEENRKKEVLKMVKDSIVQLLAYNYERVAVEILKNSEIGRRFDYFGRWWNKRMEIDIVAYNNGTKEILFGEVKWTRRQVGVNVYYDLKAKTNAVEWNVGKRKEHLVLFSKSGFTKDMIELAKTEGVILYAKDVGMSEQRAVSVLGK